MEEIPLEKMQKIVSKYNNYYLYINSPFCITSCEFCVYKSSVAGKFSQSEFDNFYTYYLPTVVSRLKGPLQGKTIESYFFGGGTPSLMDDKTFKNLMIGLPGHPRHIAFEIHPAFYSADLVKMIGAFRLSGPVGIVCLQTFNEPWMQQQRRPIASETEIRALVNLMKNEGMFVMSDVIAFGDNDVLLDDLRRLENIGVDEISVMPLFQYHNQLDMNTAKMIRRFVADSDVFNETMETPKAFRMLRKGVSADSFVNDIFPHIRALDVCGHGVNVLGIGSFKPLDNHIFSIINGDKYIEKNIKGTPHYYKIGSTAR